MEFVDKIRDLPHRLGQKIALELTGVSSADIVDIGKIVRANLDAAAAQEGFIVLTPKNKAERYNQSDVDVIGDLHGNAHILLETLKTLGLIDEQDEAIRTPFGVLLKELRQSLQTLNFQDSECAG